MRKLAIVIFDVLISVALFVTMSPFLFIGVLWASYRRLELWLSYGGDADKRDRDEYKGKF